MGSAVIRPTGKPGEFRTPDGDTLQLTNVSEKRMRVELGRSPLVLRPPARTSWYLLGVLAAPGLRYHPPRDLHPRESAYSGDISIRFRSPKTDTNILEAPLVSLMDAWWRRDHMEGGDYSAIRNATAAVEKAADNATVGLVSALKEATKAWKEYSVAVGYHSLVEHWIRPDNGSAIIIKGPPRLDEEIMLELSMIVEVPAGSF